MDDYDYDKIKDLEERLDEDIRIPICFTCGTEIQGLFYRIRYQEDENHVIFKTLFHYFPPCFNFEKRHNTENLHVITDGYEIDTKYMVKKKFTAMDLSDLDRSILHMDSEKGINDILFGEIRTDKGKKSTWIRRTPVIRNVIKQNSGSN